MWHNYSRCSLPLLRRRTLATVPLLSRVLSPSCLTTLVGRRLKPGLWPEWDVMLQEVVGRQQVPLLVMFPGPGETSSGGGGVPEGGRKVGRGV